MKLIAIAFLLATALAITDKEVFNYLKTNGGFNSYGTAGLMGIY